MVDSLQKGGWWWCWGPGVPFAWPALTHGTDNVYLKRRHEENRGWMGREARLWPYSLTHAPIHPSIHPSVYLPFFFFLLTHLFIHLFTHSLYLTKFFAYKQSNYEYFQENKRGGIGMMPKNLSFQELKRLLWVESCPLKIHMLNS